MCWNIGLCVSTLRSLLLLLTTVTCGEIVSTLGGGLGIILSPIELDVTGLIRGVKLDAIGGILCGEVCAGLFIVR
eukprot:10724617-Ditylum_brightwellii.AAC.2